MRGNRRMGFTLVEILVVVTIIGLLASILLPVVGKIRENAKRTACATLLKGVDTAFSAYYADVGRYPGDAYVNWNADTVEAPPQWPADAAATETWVYWLLNGRTVYVDFKPQQLSAAKTDPSVYLKDAWGFRVLYVVAPQNRAFGRTPNDGGAYRAFPGGRVGAYNLWSVGGDGRCDSCGEVPADYAGSAHDSGGDPEGTWHLGGDGSPNDDIRQ